MQNSSIWFSWEKRMSFVWLIYIVTKAILPIKIQELIFVLKLTINWFCRTARAPVLNFLCILSWIDVINCISNFWDYCYIIIMYSSVFNQVRRRKVLYFSSYTFSALTPVVAISHTELSVLAGSAGPTILYRRLRLLLLLDRFHKNTLRQFQSLPKRAAIPSVYLLLGCFTHWSWIT